MNRREFIKTTLLAMAATAAESPLQNRIIDDILQRTEQMPDDQFVHYITAQYHIWIDNPGSTARIDGIVE